jgi:ATP-grasp domain-containing protein
LPIPDAYVSAGWMGRTGEPEQGHDVQCIASLEDVQEVFAGWDAPVAWWGLTHLLCRGIASYVPRFVVIPQSPAGLVLCREARIPHLTPEAAADRLGGERLDVLCLVPERRVTALCASLGWRLLNMPERIIGEVGDKLRLPDLLSRSGVPVIAHRLLTRASAREADKIWDALSWPRLVVQTGENDSTGRGTFLVVSLGELKAVLEELAPRPVKVARFMAGRLLTISACATSRGTFASRLSRQLVGLDLLTTQWSAHCGNECLDEGELTTDEVEVIRRCCRRIGRELAHDGFVGQFGLDLVLDDEGAPWVLEINPRLQSVSSLVHAAELEAGDVPLQALHLLELAKWPYQAQLNAAGHSCLHSQVVIEHRGPAVIVQRAPGCGVFHLRQDELASLDPAGDLLSLGLGGCLITPFCVDGQRLASGDRIAVVQWRGPVTDGCGRLREEVAATVAAVRRGVLGALQ